MNRLKSWKILSVLFCFLIGEAAVHRSAVAQTYKPEEGYVSSADVAIKIAEAVLKSIYGENEISNEMPLVATLSEDGIWIVTGTLKPHHKGGVAEIWIAKSTGEILDVRHEQ